MTTHESDVLSILDQYPKIRQFDAFPKTAPVHRLRSSRGGSVTLGVALILLMLVWGELKSYIYGQPHYAFDVEHHIGGEMQINVDMTVAMKCHYLTVDVRDAVGDRLHISDSEFKKDGTTFDIGHAGKMSSLPTEELSLGRTISKGAKPRYSRQHTFKPTAHVVPDGPACRIYGSVEVKKVTGNLHITTLGHGYWSWEHTDHELMNLTHVVHEFSFGPYFPAIAQPLDGSVEVTKQHFTVFQYFIQIVPTRYIDRWGRSLSTNQYSVTEQTRQLDHGQGVPGLFFKFDVEPLTMIIHERATSLITYLVRLAGILGGVWVCAGFGLRLGERVVKVSYEALGGKKDEDPSDYARAYASSYSTNPSAGHYGALNSTHSSGTHHRPNAGPTPYGGGQRSASGGWIGDAVDGAKGAWQGMNLSIPGSGHKHTESVQQRIYSEEGRAPW
ncbi:DUF1692-domain-containing protein [Ceraceosorus guamensis]|uniref:DUF1692-domain-containing protein n=1 Tax=Ceraceosorus guamensis TaxID=1522189 RepID=A0A316W7P5_9BASI|nr:DUF1692-domain-containing protein [Ceraceosorus guamensis]PWN45148.1 DUF1692-domain-containing protein [Ceraceosorus guamensis]